MRILVTGTTGNSMPPPYAGVPKLVLLRGREWRKKGHEVGFTFTYDSPKRDDLDANGTYYFEYTKRPGQFDKFLFLVRYFFKDPALYLELFRSYHAICPHVTREMYLYTAYGVYLDSVYREFRPDVVLSEAALIKTFMAAKIAKKHNVPVVYDVYAEVRDLSMGENRHLNENQRKAYWVAFFGLADLVVGMDNCTVELRSYVPREKLVTFWDPVDFEVYGKDIAESKQELRTHFKLPSNMFLAAAVGSFELRKGHDHLIQAVAELVKAGKDVGLVICGSLGSHAKWKEIAKSEGLEGHAFFFTSLSETELVKLFHAVDVNTNLSNTQRMCSFDMGLTEGMAAGLPVIVYENGALPGAAANQNGYVVPMCDIHGVAEALQKLMELPLKEREEMGKRSAEIAKKRDITFNADTQLAWFTEVVTPQNI